MCVCVHVCVVCVRERVCVWCTVCCMLCVCKHACVCMTSNISSFVCKFPINRHSSSLLKWELLVTLA